MYIYNFFHRFVLLEFQDRVIFLLTDIRQMLQQGNSRGIMETDTGGSYLGGLEQLNSNEGFDALEEKITTKEEGQKLVSLTICCLGYSSLH